MRQALANAKIQPEEVDYINAHGTSTPLNDLVETKAIKAVFKEAAYKVAISSTKSMTGHCLSGASGVEAVLTIKAMEAGIVPPTINLHERDPELDLERLREIRALVGVPLVLHGGSGLSDEDFQAAIAEGVSKVNIYTNMAVAAVGAIQRSLDDPEVRYMQVQRTAQEAIKGVVVHCMQVFGSVDRA